MILSGVSGFAVLSSVGVVAIIDPVGCSVFEDELVVSIETKRKQFLWVRD
jgi:phosphopantetheine adenylyltransferase